MINWPRFAPCWWARGKRDIRRQAGADQPRAPTRPRPGGLAPTVVSLTWGAYAEDVL